MFELGIHVYLRGFSPSSLILLLWLTCFSTFICFVSLILIRDLCCHVGCMRVTSFGLCGVSRWPRSVRWSIPTPFNHVLYLNTCLLVESGIHVYLRGFSPSSLILLWCNGCLFNPGSVWTGLFVYEAVYGCNRPVNLPGEESQMGRFRLWSGGEYWGDSLWTTGIGG
jgi:hypothetical protein